MKHNVNKQKSVKIYVLNQNCHIPCHKNYVFAQENALVCTSDFWYN